MNTRNKRARRRRTQRQRRLSFEFLEDRRMLAGFEFQQKIYAEQFDADGMNLGESVDIDGEFAVIGAPNTAVLNGASSVFSGTAYVYRGYDPGTPADSSDDFWLFQTQLVPTDVGDLSSDRFGTAVAISGDTIAVGTTFDDTASSSAGAVYIFQQDFGGVDQWGEVTKITHSLANSNDNFGNSVAIDGDTLVVGAFRDDDAGGESGTAVVFERDLGGTDNWGERITLQALDAASDDEFGTSVAISGDTIVVGSPQDDDNGGFSGSAYVFERNLGGTDFWGEAKKLIGSTTNFSDRFGRSVSIDVDSIAVGAYNASGGEAFIFERNEGGADNWGEVAMIDGPSGSSSFGWSVDVENDSLVVADYARTSFTGIAFLFERDQGGVDQWGLVRQMEAPDGTSQAQFGYSVAISNSTVFVGARRDDDGDFEDEPDEADLGSGYLFVQDLGGAENVTV